MASTTGVGNDLSTLVVALNAALDSGRAGDVATVRDRVNMAGAEPACATSMNATQCAGARELLGILIDTAKEQFPAVRWGEAAAPTPAASRAPARTMEFADEGGGEITFGTADAALDTPAPPARPAPVVVRRPRPATAVAPAPAARARVAVLDEGAGSSGGSASATTSTYNPNRITLGFGTALPFTGVKMYATDYEASVPYEFNYGGAGQDDVTKGSIRKIDLNYKRLLAELAPKSGWYFALGGKISALGAVIFPAGGTISGIEVTDSASLAYIDEILDESGKASWAVSAWTVGPTVTLAYREYFEAQFGLGVGNYSRTAKDPDADFDYGTADDLNAGNFDQSTFAIHPEFAIRGMVPLGGTFFFAVEAAVGAVIPLKDQITRSEYVYEADSTIFYFSPSAMFGFRF